MKLLRVTSGHGLSIGTDHAFETFVKPASDVYDPDRVVPDPLLPLSGYTTVHVNLRTLHRNIISALEDKTLDLTNDRVTTEIINILEEEVLTITAMMEDQTTPTFYLTKQTVVDELEVLDKGFHDRLRRNMRKEGSLAARIDDQFDDIVFALSDKESPILYTELQQPPGYLIEGASANMLLFSHVPWDGLVQLTGRGDLHWLDSHTGIVKESSSMWTKYYPIPKEPAMSVLPFNVTLLQILGDKVMFKPYPISARRDLMNVAIQDNWTPLTRKRQVLSSIRPLLKKHNIQIYPI